MRYVHEADDGHLGAILDETHVLARLVDDLRTVALSEGGNLPLLLLTLAVSVVTFTSRKTNILQGCVHLLLFAVFVLLIFAP